MYCRECGAEVNDRAVVCIHCGCATGYNEVSSVKPWPQWLLIILMVLTVLFPLAGFIGFIASMFAPSRRGQGVLLLVVAIFSCFVYAIASYPI
jgi:hypothetical protein